MKKLLLVIIGSLVIKITFTQTLFTYGAHSVSKQEFFNAYKKNKINSVDEKKELQDYLNLYINFKLKVQAAKDDHLDTLGSQVYDLQNFRNQVIPNYLTDETELNRLTKEAFERSLYDLHLNYIFIPINSNADTNIRNNQAMELFKKLNNHTSLKDQVDILKTKENNITFSDAGFITVFSLPYLIENIVYNLQVMNISKPLKTASGFFIFQVNEKRKATIDKIKTAQILIALPPEATAAQDLEAKKKADSVYALLKKGNDFSALAKVLSDDRTSASNGGIMEEYGVGKYSADFESMVFALQNENEITTPFKTAYGYHIVKLLHKNLIVSDAADENNMATMKQKVLVDERIKSAKDKFITKAKNIVVFKINEQVNLSTLDMITDTFLMKGNKINNSSINDNTVLFTIKNLPVKVADWYIFLNEFTNTGSVASLPPFNELMNIFIANQVLDQYKIHLEDYNPVFKQQMKDYADGNLLFEEMERKVWSKAAADTIQLLNYFQNNKEKYNWKESAEIIIFSCKDESTASQVKMNYKLNNSISIIKQNFPGISIDSGRYELDQLNYLTPLTENSIFISKSKNQDQNFEVIKLIKKYPAGLSRSFDQARGLVINDYQNQLETFWILSLKKKYPVTIIPAVLRSLSK